MHSIDRKRGLGPFTGGQLTVIIVAICAVFALPTAARAAAGAFTVNSSGTPAVKGTNTNANGIGVAGVGKRYGVWSNGPLGVATGKPLSCDECVTRQDIEHGSIDLGQLASNAILNLPDLQHQQSESGGASAMGVRGQGGREGFFEDLTFSRPLAHQLASGHVIMQEAPYTNVHCRGQGQAEAGYLCVYVSIAENVDITQSLGFSLPAIVGRYGATLIYDVPSTGNFAVIATYTVTGE